MNDRAMDITRAIYRDAIDRRLFSDVDVDVVDEIVGGWYVIASQGVHPGSEPPNVTPDLIRRVRGQ